MMTPAQKPYSVNFYGSDPLLENDDCWYGEDFDTLEEALACYAAPVRNLNGCPASDVAWVELDGLEGPDGEPPRRKNPSFRSKRRADDSEWRQEMAMQAGMLGGIEAYNDIMGNS